MISFKYVSIVVASLLALSACSSTSNTTPAAAAPAHVRYVEGAPQLQADVNGTPVSLGVGAYLQAGSQTVVSGFYYGTISSFQDLSPTVRTLTARSIQGYTVGPLKLPALASGKNYSLVVVGSYPNSQVLAFEEPAASSEARLSLYEASPSVQHASFGSFTYIGTSKTNFKTLGNASFGNVATVSLGASVSNFGGFAGPASKPIDALPLADVDPNDVKGVLPFHNGARLSLFLFDPGGTSAGPVFGTLDP